MGILDAPVRQQAAASLAGKVNKGDEVFSVKPTGGDDVPTIRAGLLQAAGSFGQGGTLLLTPGNYNINTFSTFATTGDSTFSNYAFWVPSNVTIVAQTGASLHENIDYNSRRVMFYLEGSNITIDGLTFSNDYDMAGGSRPTSIPIAAGDAFNPASTTNVKNIRISNCTFLRSWYPTKFQFSKAGGTATAENIAITNCTVRAEPTSTSSGGFNFRAENNAGRIKNAKVSGCQVYDVTVSAGIGYYGVQDGVITGNILRGSQIDGAGIQLENGADNIAITGNSLIDHFNHIWVDDSTNATISANTMRNTTVSASFKGVRITKQGYTEDPNKLTTDIVVAHNTLRNCFVVAEAFGTPTGTPTFGSFTIADNIIRLDGATNNYGINLAGSIACSITGNRIVGALTSSIQLSPITNQYIVVEGNITTKAASESSVGFTLANTNAFRPILANNQFTNGISIGQAVSMMVGNVRIYTFTGTPEAAVSGPNGSLFLRDGGGAATTLYVKESAGTSSTGWVGK
jgi:hypothetical protein